MEPPSPTPHPTKSPKRKTKPNSKTPLKSATTTTLSAPAPKSVHLWLVQLASGQAKRLTSGPWSLPNHLRPPVHPPS